MTTATLPEINSGRQYPLVAAALVDYSDLTVEVETNLFELPCNAVITGYSVQIVTAFDGTPTIDLGIRSSVLDSLLDGVDASVVEAYGGSLYGGDFGTTNSDGLDETANRVSASVVDYVTITLHATAPTAGRARVIVEYVLVGRSQENQG